MSPFSRAAAVSWLFAVISFAAPVPFHAQDVPSIRSVHVLHSLGQVEIEIEASDPIVPRTNVLTGPDRLLVDFVNALPGTQLRNQTVNRAEVKNLRVGLFSADPPVTRIVLDLNGPQPFQVFPSGRTIIVKIGAKTATAGPEAVRSAPHAALPLVNAGYPAHAVELPAPPAPAKASFQVAFHNGLLSISSDRATLSEILFAVHQRTGAEIAIPAGAEEEKVAVELGPGPAPEVLAHLLNGSRFNFLILSSAKDPKALDQVILSPRAEGTNQIQMPPQPAQSVTPDEDLQPVPLQMPNPGPGTQAPPPPPSNEVPD